MTPPVTTPNCKLVRLVSVDTAADCRSVGAALPFGDDVAAATTEDASVERADNEDVVLAGNVFSTGTEASGIVGKVLTLLESDPLLTTFRVETVAQEVVSVTATLLIAPARALMASVESCLFLGNDDDGSVRGLTGICGTMCTSLRNMS